MQVVVLVKQVPDTETKVSLLEDRSNIQTDNIKWIINPYDEFAIEEALKLKEAGKAEKVVALSAGPERVKEALRQALAMGVEEAEWIEIENFVGHWVVAQALAKRIEALGASLVLCGKQAIDDDDAVTYAMVGECLDMPVLSVVNRLEVVDKGVKATREMGGGRHRIYEADFPVIVAVNKGINTPRYASLPGIMKAKRKEIPQHTLSSLGIEVGALVEEGDFELPPPRKGCRFIEGDSVEEKVEKLVDLLRNEAKVL